MTVQNACNPPEGDEERCEIGCMKSLSSEECEGRKTSRGMETKATSRVQIGVFLGHVCIVGSSQGFST